MSKFEELCRAYAVARKNYFDYRDTCCKFAHTLVSGMIDYFKCPKEQIKFIPLKGEVEPNSSYTVMGAIHLDDDTFWHLGVMLTLYEAPNVFPHQPVLLQLLIKKVDDYFIVKLGTKRQEFTIHEDKPDEFNPFYEFIFVLIKENHEKGLQRFLGKEQKKEEPRKIGF